LKKQKNKSIAFAKKRAGWLLSVARPKAMQSSKRSSSIPINEGEDRKAGQSYVPLTGNRSIFASVKLTVFLLSSIATTILIGAWCPQEAQVGQEKVIEQFGPETAFWLIKLGVSDIFHTPFFLTLIALLSVNLVVASCQRVFPRLLLLRNSMRFLSAPAITKLPVKQGIISTSRAGDALQKLAEELKRNFYTVKMTETELTAESGKFGRTAPSITHVGLLTLLLGVTISSWTGFSGFQPVHLGADMNFSNSEHSHLWIGKLPDWKVHVDSTRRENYQTGEAKQWYSHLTLLAPDGKVLKQKEISVNEPLEYQGVEIYQSSWGLDQLKLEFSGHPKVLNLQPMGKLYAAFLPLSKDLVMVFSVRDQTSPMRVFAKRPDWPSPKLLGEIKEGQILKLGAVEVKYSQLVPVTGLQYKQDPGLYITYAAFAFILTGVIFASFPHRQVWASTLAQNDGNTKSVLLIFGGNSLKAKTLFKRQMAKIADSLCEKLSDSHPASEEELTAYVLNRFAVESEAGKSHAAEGTINSKDLIHHSETANV
jgi:cytochrome c biogenesis protein